MRRIDIQPTRAEQAYQAILDEICEGQLRAGAHLIQEHLAEQLGVSRQPIQQAMALLKNDGLVEEAPGRGLCVTRLDPTAVRQHYEVRGALDRLSARLASERAAHSRDAALEIERKGGRFIAAGKAAVAAGDVTDMIRHDIEFHGFLYGCSGNPFLRQTAEPHWRFLRRVMGDILRRATPPADIWRQHEEILDAVVRGDAPLAEARAEQHVDASAEKLARMLEEEAEEANNESSSQMPTD